MSYQTKVRANYLNRTAKLSFFTHRQKQGDVTRIAEETGYSTSHISNMINGARRVNDTVANAMYNLTRRRMKNEQYA
jgi:ABC-type molybdenum transport system ATPase subunit/photorepair protein PhrA